MDSHAYLQQPQWAKTLQRGLFTAMYALMGVAGWAAATGLGFPAQQSGWFIMAAALAGTIGAATGYYHAELIALPVLIAGLGVCVVWLSVPPQNAVLTGWLVGAYLPSLATRMLVLNLVARRERRVARGQE